MKLYKVEKNEGYFLDFEDRILMYNLISKKIEKKGIKNFTLNVLSDHVHLVIMYNDENLSKLLLSTKKSQLIKSWDFLHFWKKDVSIKYT